MATYIVNPNDPTSPTNQQGAKQGAEELRALKALIASLVVASVAAPGVRQSIQDANRDANGYNNAITVGAGLRPGLSATTRNYQLSYANGFSGGKPLDANESVVADVADILGADLPLSNTSYLFKNFGGAYGSCLVPPQEGYTYDRAQFSLLNFEGADASVVMLDDNGNTWTVNANAQIDTAQFKFGTSSLLLDGTGDSIESANFITLGDGSWELSCWFRTNATATIHTLISAENAAGFGAVLSVDHNAGNRRLEMRLSSDGATNNIAAATGATTTIALNTWYKARLIFDALAGSYKMFLSNNGAIETLEATQASALRICSLTKLRLGDNAQAAPVEWNGWIDAFRFVRAASKTALETPALIAPVITDLPINWMDSSGYKMYQATLASTGAGVNPTLTAATRLFLGEADTSGVAVTAVRNYATQGQYIGPWVTPLTGVSTAISQNHNLGTIPRNMKLMLQCILNTASYVPGDILDAAGTYGLEGANVRVQPVTTNKNTVTSATPTTNTYVATPKTGGASIVLTAANFRYRFEVSRGW